MDMNDRILKYILEISNTGSFSEAASNLYISQPSLSKCIKTFESKHNIIIFDRSNLPITLTEEGKIFIDYATEIINLEIELKNKLIETKYVPSGEISIGISMFRNSTIIPKIYHLYRLKYPRINISLVEATNDILINKIIKNKIDLAFVNDNSNPNICYHKILSDKVLLAVGKNYRKSIHTNKISYTDYPKVNLRNFLNDTFVLLNNGSTLRRITDLIFYENKFKPKSIIETSSVELAHRLASSNIAVSFILETVISLFSDNQLANYYDFSDNEYFSNLYLCYKKNKNLTQYMSDFISIVIDEFGSVPYFV